MSPITGPADCPDAAYHGNPFRYCPNKGCGWIEESTCIAEPPIKVSPPATVGRIVHYWPTQDGHHAPWPAIITGLWDSDEGTVLLHIFTPCGYAEEPCPEDGAYPYAETPTPGHWNWPPRA